MKTPITKLLAVVLVAVMLVGVIPMYAFAASIEYDEQAGDYYKLISQKNWELAPGIVESEIVIDNENGTRRQVMHVVEVDIHNEYTKVIPSSKGMIPTPGQYGTQTMDKQAAYAEANGYGNVVAAMNISLSWYDSQYYLDNPHLVGEPLGYLVLDGVKYTNSRGQTSGAQTVLVINFDEKDGVARPDDMPKTQMRSASEPITGWEEQVIPANFGFLVKDGKLVTTTESHTGGDPRSMLGIKADGTIVMVMNDGRQSPYSAGFTSYEMGEAMLKLGCVYAINGDGGGSSQFLSQRPGEELKINCSPSDGAPRDTTHGVLVISTAPVTGEFEQVHISTEDVYYTPGSSVQFSAIGTDLVGTPAEIPANAVWELADASFGSIDQDGLFVSNGKMGDVTVQMTVDGEIVGDHTIHIVMPDTLTFAQANMTIPFGKTVKLDLTATYDNKNVVLKASDVTFTLSDNNIGSINGFDFTAGEEGLAATSSLLTAVVGEISATANLALGKGSEIFYDFENQDLTGWNIATNYPQYGPLGSKKDENGNYYYNGQNELGYISIVNSDTGKVKNGDYALAVECDFTQIYETGFHSLNLRFPAIDTKDAVAVGFWIYVPFDARFSDMTVNSVLGSAFFADGSAMELCEGWHYLSLPVADAGSFFNGVSFSVDERASGKDANGNDYYNNVTTPNLNGKFTFYFDDITLDYSTAVDDREAPIFSTPVMINPTTESITPMNGNLIEFNNATFEVAVVENTAMSNAVGIDAASAKAYVDGKAVDCAYINGKITVGGLVLADGYHTVKFVIADKMGNESWVAGSVVVSAGVDAAIKVLPQDPTADRLLIGSLYWMDVVATNIETIEKIEMVFDLNNASSWELEGLTVADGFTATYTVQADDNVATIIIERTGDVAATGDAVLASFPVRTWVSTITEYEGYEDATPTWMVKNGRIWAQSIELALQKGEITFVEDYKADALASFGMEDILVDTELFFTNYTRKQVEGAQAWIDVHKAAGEGWHEHTAEAIDDLDPTCTKDGYTGRTYCAVCDSVVDWGTKASATGHSYTVVDEMLVCGCGDTIMDTGLISANGKTYYAVKGSLKGGWFNVDDVWYYFDKVTFEGVNGEVVADNGIEFLFDQGRVVTGTWVTTAAGTRYWYGPGYYKDSSYDILSCRPYEIDGKTYLFSRDGYRQTGIVYFMYNLAGTTSDVLYYDCAEDGVASLLNGPYNKRFYKDGKTLKAYQLVEHKGDFYFINDGHKIAVNTDVYLTATNVAGKTFADGTPIPVGKYHFGADGKMVIPAPAERKNGIENGYLYIDDVKQTCYQLVAFEGNFYFITDGHKVAMNTNVYLTASNVAGKTFEDGTPIPVGKYFFNAEGKMVIPDPDTPTPPAPDAKNGIYNGYLYIDDVKQTCYKLVEFEDNFYFITDGHKVAMNTYAYMTASNIAGQTFADGTPIPVGRYFFDAEGKMVIPDPDTPTPPAPDAKNGIYNGFLYIDDVKQTCYKLVEFEGNFYFITDGHKVAVNTYAYMTASNIAGQTFADGTPIPVGRYFFNAEGKMVRN